MAAQDMSKTLRIPEVIQDRINFRLEALQVLNERCQDYYDEIQQLQAIRREMRNGPAS